MKKAWIVLGFIFLCLHVGFLTPGFEARADSPCLVWNQFIYYDCADYVYDIINLSADMSGTCHGMQPVPDQDVCANRQLAEIPPVPVWLPDGYNEERWERNVGDKLLKYREYNSTMENPINYDPPVVLAEFPVCDGDQWTFLTGMGCPAEGCQATATYLGPVIVPAGTFQDCYQIFYDLPTGLSDQTWVACPCIGPVKSIIGIITAQLKSYDRCPDAVDDEDGDGFLSIVCHPLPPCGGDCDDSNPNVNPDATEGPHGDPTCSDGLDNDCDGKTDENDRDCTSGKTRVVVIPLGTD